ncbi:MAG: hypothetical protein RMM31_01260 [Anaerolineae bacterium]|nr:hypothetical protein [Anaerolineae bacterium]
MRALIVAVLMIGLSSSARVAHAQVPSDGSAGACYAYYPDPRGLPGRPLLPLMLSAGARWERFDFPWPLFEPMPGVWNWQNQDALVSDVRASGMEILGIALWTPNWAASGPCSAFAAATLDLTTELRRTNPEAPILHAETLLPQGAANAPCATRPPQGLFEAWDDWTTADGDPINHWGRYVHTLVSRYRTQIKHWEIWNEPDLAWFWSGTAAEYAQLLKVGYQAAKAACPECTVLFGGIAFYAAPTFYTQVIDLLRADPTAATNNYFFDVMSLHLYSRSSSLFDVTTTVRNAIRSRIPDRPIWITESGVPLWDDFSVNPNSTPYIWSARQREAAAFVLQAYANARLAGAERVFFFRAHDDWCDKNNDGDCADAGIDHGMPELYGLVRDNLTLRPSYTATRLAATYLVSPTRVTFWNYAGGGRRVTFWGTPHGKVSVFWNTVPTTTTATFSAILPTATRINQDGTTQLIAPGAGQTYTFTLPGATANNGLSPNDYIIGGETFLVIEADTAPPIVQLNLSQPQPPTITVSWSGQDAQTGILGYDVQRRSALTTTWTAWLTRTTTTSATFLPTQPEAWCFRARAWDLAGNLSPWAERCAPTTRSTQIVITAVFGDLDGDGTQGATEPTLLATLRLRDILGQDVVSPTVASTWALSLTLPVGQYSLEAHPEDGQGWLSRSLTLTVSLSLEPLIVQHTFALPLRQHNVFVPLVVR